VKKFVEYILEEEHKGRTKSIGSSTDIKDHPAESVHPTASKMYEEMEKHVRFQKIRI
jgi:hypothetical protein